MLTLIQIGKRFKVYFGNDGDRKPRLVGVFKTSQEAIIFMNGYPR
jgi:hypothetical protein